MAAPSLRQLAAVSAVAVLAAAGLAPTPAAAQSGNVLSTAPGAGGAAGAAAQPREGFGINGAIREGEARRAGTQLSTGPAGARLLSPHPEYANLPVYVGTLGDQPVRLRIGPKPNERDSVHGEYSLGTSSGVRLLAGEYENGAFLMEESADGTRVTGNWEGNIDPAGIVRGQWTDPYNPAIVLPFMIRPLGVLVIPPFDMTPNSGITYAPPAPRSSISIGR
ncbi:hypothetical protein CURE108131_11505 [Cupriavidus respiraculi]|uniref:Uncharacterized protein n=1 Tax=Cupriavidus respiraculi TaxID=195930 RepID=A0ABM8WWR4_9BURK|nr:hypothetical protein [Cupriavidus respiraculi]MBY4945308.1 hypothetical protein [Cupriavidus respiraculi]CAG9171944.1 hypothetical protein LMG21510_01822 [Cupriavidus respiraculi]